MNNQSMNTSSQDDCIFCQIVSGSSPSFNVMENENCLAILDIAPAGQGHTLIIPKAHFGDVLDIDPELLGDVMKLTQRVAVLLDQKLRPDGLSIFQMSREAGGQTVFHFHIHLVPRWRQDGLVDPWVETPATSGELLKVFQSITQ